MCIVLAPRARVKAKQFAGADGADAFNPHAALLWLISWAFRDVAPAGVGPRWRTRCTA
jgi:hypothetical protein